MVRAWQLRLGCYARTKRMRGTEREYTCTRLRELLASVGLAPEACRYHTLCAYAHPTPYSVLTWCTAPYLPTHILRHIRY
eukprot:2766754-Rhodomonas_salina.1